jgi:hypothetical protein
MPNEAPAIPTNDPSHGSTPVPHEPTYEELARELSELEKQFPPPERGDLIPDARWYEANAPALYEQYRGMHIAIMNGAVVGHDRNELQLRLDVARKYNIHPYGFLVVHLFSVFG